MDKIIVEELKTQEKQEPAKVLQDTEPVEHLVIADHFNIDTPTKQENNKLMTLWEHAKGVSESKENQDVIWQIISLERTLGAPRLGESRLDRLYRYAKLKKQELMIQEQLKSV